MKTTTRRIGSKSFAATTSAEGLSSEQTNSDLPSFSSDAALLVDLGIAGIYDCPETYHGLAGDRPVTDRGILLVASGKELALHDSRVKEALTRGLIKQHGQRYDRDIGPDWAEGVARFICTKRGLQVLERETKRLTAGGLPWIPKRGSRKPAWRADRTALAVDTRKLGTCLDVEKWIGWVRLAGPVSRELSTSILRASWVTQNQEVEAAKQARKREESNRFWSQLRSLPSLNPLGAA